MYYKIQFNSIQFKISRWTLDIWTSNAGSIHTSQTGQKPGALWRNSDPMVESGSISRSSQGVDPGRSTAAAFYDQTPADQMRPDLPRRRSTYPSESIPWRHGNSASMSQGRHTARYLGHPKKNTTSPQMFTYTSEQRPYANSQESQTSSTSSYQMTIAQRTRLYIIHRLVSWCQPNRAHAPWRRFANRTVSPALAVPPSHHSPDDMA